MERSQFRALTHGYRTFTGGSEKHFLDQKITVEIEGRDPTEYSLQDREDYRGWSEDLIRELFEQDNEFKGKITLSYTSRTEIVLYDGAQVRQTWQNTERCIREDIQKTKEINRKMDGWQPALDWARENGAAIRKGKISKQLARVRIQEAGLREQWNQQFPDYAFTEDDVIRARHELDERAKYYAKKHKERKE